MSSKDLQRTSHSWKDFSAMEQRNCCGRKAIHYHRTDQNSHQRWSDSQREPALHHPPDRGRDPLFSRTSRAAALDAICTHSAEFGFCLRFSMIWAWFGQSMLFFKASRLKAGVCQCVTHRTAEPTVSQFCNPKRCYCPSVLRGLSKGKDMPKDFFTMGDNNQSCNGIIVSARVFCRPEVNVYCQWETK